MFYFYMIKNEENNLYIGVTENPKRRLSEHNNKQGAKFTKGKSKFKIVFLEKYDSLDKARSREIQVKKWRRDKKDFLINKYNKNLETKI